MILGKAKFINTQNKRVQKDTYLLSGSFYHKLMQLEN